MWMLMSGIPVGVAPHCMSTFLRYISSASAASSVSFSDLMHPTRWTTLLFQFLIYFFQTSHLLAMMHGRPQLIYVLSVVGQDAPVARFRALSPSMVLCLAYLPPPQLGFRSLLNMGMLGWSSLLFSVKPLELIPEFF
jgi:hypothetical protein